MKKYVVLSAIIIFFAATNIKGQMIVKVKPHRPNVVIVKPNKVYKNKVWVDGHWKWSKRSQNYQWTKGHWVKRRPNNRWVVGKWQKVPSGWKYVPGRWARG